MSLTSLPAPTAGPTPTEGHRTTTRSRRATAAVALVGLLLAGAACEDGGDGDTPASPAATVTVTTTEVVTEAPTDDAVAPEGDGCQQLTGGDGLAFVFVTTPTVGAQVEPGFTFAGCANAFEASFQWALRDADGNVLADGFGTASCGTGCVGTFSVQVPYQVDGPTVGALEVWTSSAKDGSKRDVNHLPLVLNP